VEKIIRAVVMVLNQWGIDGQSLWISAVVVGVCASMEEPTRSGRQLGPNGTGLPA
jgi:hypothetical protein